MAKNGFRVFDADAHIMEPGEIIEEMIESRFLTQLKELSQPGQRSYALNRHPMPRVLGTDDTVEPLFANSKAGGKSTPRYRVAPDADTNVDPSARVRDLDVEGIDASVLYPTSVGTFCSVDDVELERAVLRAYHRYVGDFCKQYPDRLFGTMLVSGRAIQESVAEMRALADDDWMIGIFPSLPPGMGLDDPPLEPIWATAAELELTVALHTFTQVPPYAPGVRDGSFHGNMWLARSAAHPWCGMRNMAALLGAGVIQRHEGLRIAVVEAGHGWLPYWIARLDEQAEYLRASLPEGFRPIREAVSSGRYFQAIELHEGAHTTRQVIDAVGEDVLMWSSDYPHGETWFPDAVDSFLAWGFDEQIARKVLWDNAMRAFPRVERVGR